MTVQPVDECERLTALPTSARLALPALIHRDVQRLLGEHSELVKELVSGLGSPLHFLLPRVFDETVRQFEMALADARVEGLILFAKKSNKARCFVQRCAELNIGVDAASLPELEKTLGAGVPGELIGVSGPAKTAELIRLALRHGCFIAIDCEAELMQVEQFAASANITARVLLRCRSELPGQTQSRFGMTAAERVAAMQRCVRARAHIQLEGFAFHLAGYCPMQRAEMATQMIALCLEGRALGLACHTINIGGGFAVRYVRPPDWQRFLQQQSPSDFHAAKRFKDFYPYGSVSAGAAMLAEILAAPVDGAVSLGASLGRHGIRMMLEPGRSLLDQAGITAFRVQGVKDREVGDDRYAILTTEGTSFSLSEQWFDSEYLPDPILLGVDAEQDDERPFAACVGGSSCLDSDMLSWRKIALPRRVERGDILLYANTAGYQMDSNESPFHDLPLPRKVVLTVDSPRVRWRLDDAADWQPSPKNS
jgi:diaminopimelate decarboxylase